jgi:hypothetical protein
VEGVIDVPKIAISYFGFSFLKELISYVDTSQTQKSSSCFNPFLVEATFQLIKLSVAIRIEKYLNPFFSGCSQMKRNIQDYL